MKGIDLRSDLHRVLLSVEKPGRYSGGEYGSVLKDDPRLLRFAVSYPDMYEIGMSNLAVQLLYKRLNAMEGVQCERVFAPAGDFEAELRARGLPLYSLESGTPLCAFDLVGFSVGYELTLTNLLNILDLGGIRPLCRDRAEGEPVVLGGGPALTNPVPFGAFLDAVFIGEFEEAADQLIPPLRDLKFQGAGRQDLLEYLRGLPYVWAADKQGRVRRLHWRGFGQDPAAGRDAAAYGDSLAAPFPVPNIATVQDHGVVEIMRGCPNGCRFCHAGSFYRPFRQKDPEQILREVEEQVLGSGYREITLSSLSSGDYPGLQALVKGLTRHFAPHKVSFSLPSLRINSLTLDLLSELSAVRKSGLTFAVETPREEWQRALNKPAPLKRTLDLLSEARERGWRNAKFYFMVGLPVTAGDGETDSIIEFLTVIRRRIPLSLNVNVSCFIPKPHTPFQWAAQLGEQQALDRIMAVKRAVGGRGVSVRYHSPFLSLLEGVLSRGDQRAGELFYRAFREGARFDSWEELFRWELWRRLIVEAPWPVEQESCRARAADEPLPWREVELGVSTAFLRREYEKALGGELSAPCCPGCRDLCGVCGRGAAVREIGAVDLLRWERSLQERGLPQKARAGQGGREGREEQGGREERVLFSFAKQGAAVYLSHLNLMQIFERALLRAGYQACFTEGFNPKPRLEFAQPLSLGIASQAEIALVELQDFDHGPSFSARLNEALPEGLRIVRALRLPAYRTGQKKHSLMSLYWGSEYRIDGAPELIAALSRVLGQEGTAADVEVLGRQTGSLLLRVRQPQQGSGNILRLLEGWGAAEPLRSGIEVTRLALLARAGDGADSPPLSYFDSDLLRPPG